MRIKLILFKCFHSCCYLSKAYDKRFMYVSMTHVMKILVIFVTLPFGFKAKTKIMRSDIDRNYFFAIHMAPCVKDVNVILVSRGFDSREFGTKEEYARFEAQRSKFISLS